MKENSIWSQDKYIRAVRFAAHAHNGQFFKGTELPYLLHLSMVSMEVIAATAVEKVSNPDLAVECAILHDVIEDTDITFEEISREFGEDVARGVLALTKDTTIKKKKDRLADSLKRIQDQPNEVWMVKMADRITNLQSPPSFWSQKKIKSNWEGAKLIHASLKGASPFLGKRLSQKIDEYERYFK